MTHRGDLSLQELGRQQWVVTHDYKRVIRSLLRARLICPAIDLPRVSSLTSVVLTRGMVAMRDQSTLSQISRLEEANRNSHSDSRERQAKEDSSRHDSPEST